MEFKICLFPKIEKNEKRKIVLQKENKAKENKRYNSM